jgi:hypothetical protein
MSQPTRRARMLVAAGIATVATFFPIAEHFRLAGRSTDFGLAWFGARSVLHGVNPYPLVGPGRMFDWDWAELLYPVPAMLLAAPLSWLPQIAASAIFVWLSAFLLAFAVTKDNWDRLFIFPSSAFIVAARAAQWSPLLSAAFCLPALGFVLSAKPNIGVAMLGASDSPRLWKSALTGGVILLVLSFILFPSWLGEWLRMISQSHVLIPAARPFGFLVPLLALLRWRRSESRLIAALSLVPQTGSWYEALPLMLAGQSRREVQVLSLVSSLGFLLIPVIIHGQPEAQFNREVMSLMLAFAYLPAVIVVLKKPNEGAPVPWMSFVRHRVRA